jgi:hypothetical protein
VNGPAARLCIWCGALMDLHRAGADFEAAQMEVEYLEGIERLDDPTPVRLAVGPAGVEVCEMLPGSRTVIIPTDELVDARVVDSSLRNSARPSLLKRVLGPFANLNRERDEEMEKRDYRLIIRYTKEGETREAVFRREDQTGFTAMNAAARVISLLVKRRAGRKS